jgi:carbamoyl-phosphate synthase large subunit
VFILEANPRASRTVPFVSKAIGVPLAKIASRVMSGKSLIELGFTEEIIPTHVSVKEAVLPFAKFPGTDVLLGPEMRSTGEVMGIDTEFGKAFAKAELAAGQVLPLSGTVFISVNERDKQAIVPVVRDFLALGFKVTATIGTRKVLWENEVKVEMELKLHEGRPNILDAIKNQAVQLAIITPSGEESRSDGILIRRSALAYKIPIITTIAGAKATVAAIHSLKSTPLEVKAIQDYYI